MTKQYTMQAIYSSEHTSILHAIESERVYLIWKPTFVNVSIFKQQLDQLVKVVSAKRPSSILVDARDHKFTVPKEVQTWHDETVVPAYLKSGVKKMAFVVPNSIFAEVTTKNIFSQDNAKKFLPTQFFDSELEATTWLNKDE